VVVYLKEAIEKFLDKKEKEIQAEEMKRRGETSRI